MLIKCYFRWVKALYTNAKKLGYFENNKITRTKEMLSNVKFMAFLQPKLLKKFYSKIIDEYGSDHESFFKYFQNNWINIKRLGKYTPIFNYYENISNSEFDIKFLFLTNNISENINKLLNSYFNTKYPTFSQWKQALLDNCENFGKNDLELTRRNIGSKSMIYYIKNIFINNKNPSLLSSEDIKNLNLLSSGINNENILSSSSISKILNIDNNDFNIEEIDNQNNDEELKEVNNNSEDDINDLSNKFDNINFDDDKDLKYYIIQNIKDINLEKINKEIDDEIKDGASKNNNFN